MRIKLFVVVISMFMIFAADIVFIFSALENIRNIHLLKGAAAKEKELIYKTADMILEITAVKETAVLKPEINKFRNDVSELENIIDILANGGALTFRGYRRKFDKLTEEEYGNAIKAKAVWLEMKDYTERIIKGEKRLNEEIYLKHHDIIGFAEKIEISADKRIAVIEVSLKNIIYFSAVILGLLFVLLIIIINTAVLKPLREIKNELGRMSQKDFSQKIDNSEKGEMGEIISKLNDAVKTAEAELKTIEENREIIYRISYEIEKNFRELEDGIESAEESVEIIKNKIRENKLIKAEIEESISNIYERVNEILSVSEKGGAEIDGTTKQMVKIGINVNESLSMMDSIAEETKKIERDILEINDIVKESQILAFNSAIEASRKSGQGSGFGGVAVLLEKLSDKTAVISKNIKMLMAEIRGKSIETAKKIEKNIEELNNGLRTDSIIREEYTNISENADKLKGEAEDISGIYKNESERLEKINSELDSIRNNYEESLYIIKSGISKAAKVLEFSEKFRIAAKPQYNEIKSSDTGEKVIIPAEYGREEGYYRDEVQKENGNDEENEKFIKWGTDFMIGMHVIDTEHRELVETVNKLIAAIYSGKGKGEIEDILKYLGSYTIKHFDHEEEIMRAIKYPFIDEQIREHDFFRKRISEIIQKFMERGSYPGLVIEIRNDVADWVSSHIKGVDVKITKYL